MQSGVLLGSLFLLSGCGDDPEATLRLRVTPGTSVQVGEPIMLDATDSVYDGISWSLDNALYGPCQTLMICTLTFNQPGNHTMAVEVTKSYTPDWTGTTRSGESRDGRVLTLEVLP